MIYSVVNLEWAEIFIDSGMRHKLFGDEPAMPKTGERVKDDTL